VSPAKTAAVTLRDLPKVDAVLAHPQTAGLISAYGRAIVANEVRGAIESLRGKIRDGNGSSADDAEPTSILDAARARLEAVHAPAQCRVINATGVILHTSLGRAPLAPTAMAAAAKHAALYSLLELDRETGKRSDRDKLVNGLITRVTGAEAATVVNNNAAATMLILNTMADGREVVCSRAVRWCSTPDPWCRPRSLPSRRKVPG
jgi:L-seryl-tRNA(Ser) seleniumtransferase